MFILTFTFGTVVAMLLPIITAIFGLLSTLAIIRMLGHVTDVPTVAPTLATMIGLGVGIDYALFIVTRHFRWLAQGLDMDESIARAAATSGGAVFFAGCTVTIALVSLAVAQIPLVTTMGLMAAIAVVVAVCAALTLLPAVLAILGGRISTRCAYATRRPTSRCIKACGRSGPMRSPSTRWSPGLAALAILIPLSIPLLSLTLGQQDVGGVFDIDDRAPGLRPDDGELRPGQQRSADHRGHAGTRRRSRPSSSQARCELRRLGVVVSSAAASSQSDPRATDPRSRRCRRTSPRPRGSLPVTPIQVDKAGTSGVLQRDLQEWAGRQQDHRPRQHLRDNVIPKAEKGTNMRADVGGTTAATTTSRPRSPRSCRCRSSS